MGVEYFNCGECDTIICDAGEYYTFIIQNAGDLTVCPDCKDDLIHDLEIAKMPKYYYCAENLKSGKRFFYQKKKYLKILQKKYPKNKYRFGIITNEYLKPGIKNSFLNKKSCGMDNDDILEELINMQKFVG